MKKTLIVLVLLTTVCLASAYAEEAGILGRPFPDITVTDTQGNVAVTPLQPAGSPLHIPHNNRPAVQTAFASKLSIRDR